MVALHAVWPPERLVGGVGVAEQGGRLRPRGHDVRLRVGDAAVRVAARVVPEEDAGTVPVAVEARQRGKADSEGFGKLLVELPGTILFSLPVVQSRR